MVENTETPPPSTPVLLTQAEHNLPIPVRPRSMPCSAPFTEPPVVDHAQDGQRDRAVTPPQTLTPRIRFPARRRHRHTMPEEADRPARTPRDSALFSTTVARGAAVDERWSSEAMWPGAPESVALARDFVADELRDNRLPGLVDEARLVASELATNAVRHARDAVRRERRAQRTATSRSASGTGRRSRAVAEPPAPLATNGHGLMLVSALSVTWGITVKTDGGKSVWARFRTPDL